MTFFIIVPPLFGCLCSLHQADAFFGLCEVQTDGGENYSKNNGILHFVVYTFST